MSEDGNVIDLALSIRRQDSYFLLVGEGKLNGPRNLLPKNRRLHHLSNFVSRKLRWGDNNMQKRKTEGIDGENMAEKMNDPATDESDRKIENGLDCGYSLHMVCPCRRYSMAPFYVRFVFLEGVLFSFHFYAIISHLYSPFRLGCFPLCPFLSVFISSLQFFVIKYIISFVHLFFHSEVIPNTLNPDWFYMDTIKLSKNKNLFRKFFEITEFYIRIYSRPSFPNRVPTFVFCQPILPQDSFSVSCGPSCPCEQVNSPERATEGSSRMRDGEEEGEFGGMRSDPSQQLEGMKGMKVIYESFVFLQDLGYIGQLESISPYFKQNTLLFQLTDGYYASPETIKSICQSVSLPLDLGIFSPPPSLSTTTTEGVASPSMPRINLFLRTSRSYNQIVKKNKDRTIAVTRKMEENRDIMTLRSKLSDLQYRLKKMKKNTTVMKRELDSEKKGLEKANAEILFRAERLQQSHLHLTATRDKLTKEMEIFNRDLSNVKEVGFFS